MCSCKLLTYYLFILPCSKVRLWGADAQVSPKEKVQYCDIYCVGHCSSGALIII